MAGYTVQVPEVTFCGLTPNPVGQNAALKISVTITEKTVELEPYYYFGGDLFAGEV